MGQIGSKTTDTEKLFFNELSHDTTGIAVIREQLSFGSVRPEIEIPGPLPDFLTTGACLHDKATWPYVTLLYRISHQWSTSVDQAG